MRLKNPIENFEKGILPYFFNTSGKLCPKRLSSMVVMLIAWLGTLHYCFGDEPWQDMPGVILPLFVLGCLAEIDFVIEQVGHKPSWGGLDPLGWATDHNGHPSTHRVKSIVSHVLGCAVILVDTFRGELSPGRNVVALFLITVPFTLSIILEFVERRGTAKGAPK